MLIQRNIWKIKCTEYFFFFLSKKGPIYGLCTRFSPWDWLILHDPWTLISLHFNATHNKTKKNYWKWTAYRYSMSQLNFSLRDYLDRCLKNTLTCLSLHQSVCDVPPSCFTRSDDLYYLEKFKTKHKLFSAWLTACSPTSPSVWPFLCVCIVAME